MFKLIIMLVKIVMCLNVWLFCACKNDLSSNQLDVKSHLKIYSVGRLENNRREGLWRYFNSEGALIYAKFYKQDSLILEAELKDAIHTTRQIPEIGISLSYPSSWVALNEEGVILALKKQCTEEFCTNLVISEFIDTEHLGQQYYAEQYLELIKTRFPRSEILYMGKKEYNSFLTYIIDFKFIEEGLELGGTIAILQVELDKYIIFNHVGLNRLDGRYFYDRLLFEEILYSIVESE
jgi:hypothetical protein